MSHLNIAFIRYASIGTVMHYILVISVQGRSRFFAILCGRLYFTDGPVTAIM